MAAYIASQSPLPVIPFLAVAPAFNVSELTVHERPVLQHLAWPQIRQAGSHTCCGCGFNEGREHPQVYDDPAPVRADALESAAQLARYIREHHVEQIYSCWVGDEGAPRTSARRIKASDLVAEDFYFRERELLSIDHEAG